MADIEWGTYTEPVRHTLAQVTETNVLDFCREYGWTLSYSEKRVAPFPDGRAMVMRVAGASLGVDQAEVPFWVELRGDRAYRANAPRKSWAVEA